MEVFAQFLQSSAKTFAEISSISLGMISPAILLEEFLGFLLGSPARIRSYFLWNSARIHFSIHKEKYREEFPHSSQGFHEALVGDWLEQNAKKYIENSEKSRKELRKKSREELRTNSGWKYCRILRRSSGKDSGRNSGMNPGEILEERKKEIVPSKFSLKSFTRFFLVFLLKFSRSSSRDFLTDLL